MAMFKFTPQGGGKSKWEEEEEKKKKEEQSYNSFVDSLLGNVRDVASQVSSKTPLPTVDTKGMTMSEKLGAAANAVGYQLKDKKYTLENGGYTDWNGNFTKVDPSKSQDLYVDSTGSVKERPKLYTEGDRAGWLNLNKEQQNALTVKNINDVRDFQNKINSGEYYYLDDNANRSTDLLSTEKRKDVITGLEQERQAHNKQVQSNVWDKNNVIDQTMIDNWHNSFENNALEAAYNNTHVGDGTYNQVIINKYNELFGDELMRNMGHTIDPYSYDYRNLDPEKLRSVFEQEDIKQLDRDIIANNQDYFSTNEAYIEGMGLEKWVDVTDTQRAYNDQKDRQIAEIQKGIDMDNAYNDYINQQYGIAGTGTADKSRAAEAEHAHFLISTPGLSHRDVTSPNGEVSNIIFMTDREKEIAERYYKAGDTAGMMAFIDGLSPYLDQAKKTYNEQNLMANADVLPVTSTALSVGSNLVGGILGTFESIKELATNEADPNSAGKNLSRSTQDIRGRVSSNLAELGTINDFVSSIAGKPVEVPLFGNKSLGDVYNASMSGIDSALTSKIGVLTNSAKAVSLGLMGLEAFSSTYTQEIDSGKDPSEAVLRAATDAGLEVATEIWSVDELLKDPGEFKNWFTQFLRVYGAEVSEEVVGQVLSPVLEYMETGENEYTRMYQDLLANQDTMPEDDRAAVNKAIWENIFSPAFDMLFSTAPQNFIMNGRQAIEDRNLGKTITQNDSNAGVSVGYDQYVADNYKEQSKVPAKLRNQNVQQNAIADIESGEGRTTQPAVVEQEHTPDEKADNELANKIYEGFSDEDKLDPDAHKIAAAVADVINNGENARAKSKNKIRDNKLAQDAIRDIESGTKVRETQEIAEEETKAEETKVETAEEVKTEEEAKELTQEVADAIEEVTSTPAKTSTPENLMKIGKSINASENTKAVIEAIEKRAAKGKAPTLIQIGSLYRNVSNDIAMNMATGRINSTKAFEHSLSEYVATELQLNGYDGNVNLRAMADGIAQATMEGIRSVDAQTRNAIINSKAAMDLVRQLTSDSKLVSEQNYNRAKTILSRLGSISTQHNALRLQEQGVVGVSQQEANARNEMERTRIAAQYMNQILTSSAEQRAQLISNMAAAGADQAVNTKNIATRDEIRKANGTSAGTARSVIVDGVNHEIASISIAGNDVTVTMADGSKASIYDVKTTNKGMSTILNFAEQNKNLFGEKVFNNMIHAFNGTNTNEALSLIGDVASIYTAAFMEQAMPQNLSIRTGLTQTVYKQAQADYAEAEKARLSRKVINTGSGQVSYEDDLENRLTSEQKQGVEDLKALGRALGYDFVLYDGKNQNLGSYNVATGAIRLDVTQREANGANSLLIAAGHEITHFIEHNSPTQYAKLRSYVINSLNGKVNFERLVQQKMAREGVGKMTYAGAVAEVVADACQDIIPNSQKIQELMKTDQSLFEDFKGYMKGFVDRVRKAIGRGGRSVETKVLHNADLYNEELAKLWDAALTEALGESTEKNAPAEKHKIIVHEFNTLKEALDHSGVEMASENEVIKPQDEHTGSISPESGDISFSIRENRAISDRSIKYFNGHRNQSEHISEEAFNAANDIINEMADYMKPFLDSTNNKGLRYLPEEILGKTTFQNGSYGKTIENTTICFRTLAYIDFTNEIKERIGRPLTVEESFLASQMLYDIAKEPQCLYCYVSLDRKAYDGFLLEYTKQRDNVIEKYNALEDKSKANIDKLYEEFLNGRKNTKQMRNRFDLWINTAKNGGRLIGNADLTTEERRSLLKNGTDNSVAKQIIDAEKYAQSASWAKKLEQYRSYNSDILSMSDKMVNTLNAHYGLRFYSFSEYTPAFILENMQQIRDASIKGLYGLAYTKKTDFARIFANTGMNINISCFGRMDHGQVVPDTYQGADWAEVQQLRKEHKNVGAVFVATNDQMTEWALSQDWIDVVIPFHIVRTGANVAEFYKWTNNTAEQADKNASGKNMTISPSEFHNDRDTFMRLVQERELTPRFSKWLENPNYMKLVNETRLSDLDSEKLHPDFDLDAAKKSFDTFVEDGGYYGNWYEEGADYEEAVKTVTEDILAGKRANEVEYGRQDFDMSDAKRNRNKRIHGQGVSVQHAIRTVNNKYYVEEDRQVISGDDPAKWAVQVTNYINNTIRKGFNVLVYAYDGTPLTITEDTAGKAAFRNEVMNPDGTFRPMTDEEYSIKLRAESHIDELSKVSARKGDIKKDTKNHKFAKDGFEYREAYWKDSTGYYKLTLSVGINGKINSVYNVGKINKSQFPSEAQRPQGNQDSKSITDKGDLGNAQNSVRSELHPERDSDGNTLSSNQQKYFADSKIRDEDGNLRVVYHGTDQEFTVFDRTKGRANMDIQGSFFSPWEDDAGGYGGEVKAYYLNITNPASESEGYKALNMFKGQNNAGVKARDYLESLGYDGVNNGDEEYIAFNPEQIKEVGNKNPTSDPDIRYSTRDELLDVRSYLASIDPADYQFLTGEKIKRYQSLYKAYQSASKEYEHRMKQLDDLGKQDYMSAAEVNVIRDYADRAGKRLGEAWDKLYKYETSESFGTTIREAEEFVLAAQNFGLTEAQEKYKTWTKGDIATQLENLQTRTEKQRHNRDVRADINSLKNKIQHNVKWVKNLRINETDYKNIPEGLKPMADKFVEIFLDKDKPIGSVVFSSKDAAILAEKYAKLAENSNTEDMYSDDVLEMLQNVEKSVETLNTVMGTTLSLEEKLDAMKAAYEQVGKATEQIRDMIKAAQDVFLEGKKIDAAAAAQQIIDPAREQKDYKEFKGSFGKRISGMDKLIRRGNMTPDYFFRNLRNEGLSKANENFHRGENQYGIDLKAAKDHVDGLREKFGYKKWDNKKEIKLITEQGRPITLTTQQAMSLYATWKREHQDGVLISKHLENGGFVFSDTDADKGGLKRESSRKSGNKLTEVDMGKITALLTQEQKGYVDAMVSYLSNEMGEKGNRTSMQMFGIRKYNERYYFPVKSFAGNLYQRSDVGSVSGTNDNRIKHASFTHSRLNNAQNAIMLEDFDAVCANHINQMLTYANMAIPIETMNRLLNVKDATEDGSEQSVRALIEQKYGSNAANYLMSYLKDLNGGVSVDNRGDLGAMLSTFKKAAVAGSMSVAMQQPLSYIRASMMVNPKYLAAAMNPASFKGSYTEMLEHSGVAVIKDMGRFDMGYGRGAVNWLLDEEQSLYEKVSDKITILPELMDKATWSRMWTAVKLEQMAEHPDMDHKSKAFLDMVGVRFNDVMRLTQVYDSVLAKSENMRSKNYGAKILTSFMAEPTLTANMLYDAFSRVKEKGGKAMMAKAGALFLISAAAQAAIKGMFGTGRRPDENKTKEEEYWYKFLQSFLSEANPLGLIPGFSTLMDALSGADIDDSAWSVVTQMGDSLQNTAKMIGKGEFNYQGIEESVGLMAQLFTSIPLKNLMRDGRAFVNWFGGAPYANRETSKAVLKYQSQEVVTASDMIQGLNQILVDAGWGGLKTTNTAYYERIYNAQESGKTDEAEAMTEYLILGKGVKPETVTNGVKKASGGYGNLWEAIDTNKSDNIKKAVASMEKYGYTKTGMISQITGQYKNEYLNASTSEKVKIKNKLILAYKVCGLTEDEANKKINSWKEK